MELVEVMVAKWLVKPDSTKPDLSAFEILEKDNPLQLGDPFRIPFNFKFLNKVPEVGTRLRILLEKQLKQSFPDLGSTCGYEKIGSFFSEPLAINFGIPNFTVRAGCGYIRQTTNFEDSKFERSVLIGGFFNNPDYLRQTLRFLKLNNIYIIGGVSVVDLDMHSVNSVFNEAGIELVGLTNFETMMREKFRFDYADRTESISG